MKKIEAKYLNIQVGYMYIFGTAYSWVPDYVRNRYYRNYYWRGCHTDRRMCGAAMAPYVT